MKAKQELNLFLIAKKVLSFWVTVAQINQFSNIKIKFGELPN
jgi:hypothetical protein